MQRWELVSSTLLYYNLLIQKSLTQCSVLHMAVTTSVNYVQGPLSESEVFGEKTLTSKHDPTNMELINITPSTFYDILKQSQEVLMRPMLLMTGGLPKSGKSQAVNELLQLKSDESSNQQQGFACYNMMFVINKQKEIDEIAKNPQLFHDFGFLAGLTTSLRDECQKISSFTEDGPQSALDSDDIHREHRMGLKAKWEKLMGDKYSDESQLFHSRKLAKGPALVKIWDVAFDSFSSQFLRCFSGHFYNSYIWLFTDAERDLSQLHLPPSKDDTQLMARRSRIQYLLNPSKLSSNLNGTRHDVCTIFAINSKHKIDELQNQVSKLQEECKIAAPQFGCSELISKLAIPLNSSDNTKKLFNQLAKIAIPVQHKILLSHLFLQGSLELESSVFMRREELKRKARLCGIDDESFDEFCKSFTSFGSIIDVSLVSTSDIIIVKPDKFLTTLDQAFNFQRIKKYQVARNGLLTSHAAVFLLGEDHQLYLEVLEAVGLATSVAGGQCSPSQDGKCFYIPSLRLHGEEMYFNPNHIQLVTSMRYPSISLIVALTKHLLQAIPNSELVLTIDRSKTSIKHFTNEVEIIFHGEVIEFAVSPEQDKRFIEEIIKACKRLPYLLTNRYGEAKFYFAVLCEKHDNYIAVNFYRRRHILPIGDELDCDRCVFTENMKIWSSEINKVGLDEEFKLDGRLTRDDITKLATKISKYERVYVLEFIKALGQDRQLPDDRSQWEDILMAAISEWMVKPHQESTKKKMAVILIELHMEFKHSHTETKPRFKQLARQLDIQTLTIEQIKRLSKYYQNQLDLEMKNKDCQISQLTQTSTRKDENIQEIIKQLYSQKNPIVFEYGAEEKELEIIDKLKLAIQEREKSFFSEFEKQVDEKNNLIASLQQVSTHSAELQKQVNEQNNLIASLQQVSTRPELQIQPNKKDSHIELREKTAVKQPQQDNTKPSIDTSHPVVHNDVQFALDDVSKLMVILQPVKDDWYQLGYHLDMEESTLNDVKETDIPLEYLLQRWCSEGGTLTKLEKALTSLGKTDLIPSIRKLKLDSVQSPEASPLSSGAQPTPTSTKEVDLKQLIRVINGVLVSRHANLTRLPEESLQDFADQLFASNLISESVKRNPTMDMCIRDFRASLDWFNNQSEIQSQCSKLLKAFMAVSGSYSTAANALKENLIEAVNNELHCNFIIES